jgi:carotenoid cleavage oxygenase
VVIYDLAVTFDAQQAAEMAVPRFLRAPARLVMSALIGRVPIPGPIAAAVGKLPPNGLLWEPCYVFHPLNAYDDGATIVLEVVRHPHVFDLERLGPDEAVTTLVRWTVDLNAGKGREEQVRDQAQEFPRVDERLVGRRHRYGYAVAAIRAQCAAARARHPTRCSSTTSCAARPRGGPSARAGRSASSSSYRTLPTPPRTTVC